MMMMMMVIVVDLFRNELQHIVHWVYFYSITSAATATNIIVTFVLKEIITNKAIYCHYYYYYHYYYCNCFCLFLTLLHQASVLLMFSTYSCKCVRPCYALSNNSHVCTRLILQIMHLLLLLVRYGDETDETFCRHKRYHE